MDNEEEENAGQAKIKDVCCDPEPGLLSRLKSWEYFLTISFINRAINPPFPLLNDVLAALIAFWSLPVIKIVPILFKTFLIMQIF